jgi:hypothetical protein
MVKNGKSSSKFHHVLSEHEVTLQNWVCSNRDCRLSMTASIYGLLGTSVQTDLQKLHAELGAELSYGQSDRILQLMTAGKRSVNNRERIRRTVKSVGQQMDNAELAPEIKAENASELYVHVDGGYVHHWDERGKNIEILVGKIYSPNAVIKQSEGHCKIVPRGCFSSAKLDKHNSIQPRLLSSARSKGLTKQTKVTAFFDGAANCRKVAKVLEPHCKEILFVLNWFHIAKRFTVLKNSLPITSHPLLADAKQALWKGEVENALNFLIAIRRFPLNGTCYDRLDSCYDYIKNNRASMVNYNKRYHANLPITSHVAESTVEHLLNQRCRKKQKMQWSRSGADNVLQLRCAIASEEWEKKWKYYISKKYAVAA